MQSVAAGDVILVPEGTYHIVSHYGDGNSVVRSDIRVQTGKLIDAVVTHRAAIITLKLVSQYGGEARANTQWSVLTPGGDVVKESIGAFPRVILAEGEYRARRAQRRPREALRAHLPGGHRRRHRSRSAGALITPYFGSAASPSSIAWIQPFWLAARRPAASSLRRIAERAFEPRARLVADERQLVERQHQIDLPARIVGVGR